MKLLERTIEAFVAQIDEIIRFPPRKTEYCTSRDISMNFSIDESVLTTVFSQLVLSETATTFTYVVCSLSITTQNIRVKQTHLLKFTGK